MSADLAKLIEAADLAIAAGAAFDDSPSERRGVEARRTEASVRAAASPETVRALALLAREALAWRAWDDNWINDASEETLDELEREARRLRAANEAAFTITDSPPEK